MYIFRESYLDGLIFSNGGLSLCLVCVTYFILFEIGFDSFFYVFPFNNKNKEIYQLKFIFGRQNYIKSNPHNII